MQLVVSTIVIVLVVIAFQTIISTFFQGGPIILRVLLKFTLFSKERQEEICEKVITSIMFGRFTRFFKPILWKAFYNIFVNNIDAPEVTFMNWGYASLCKEWIFLDDLKNNP